ncbi:MAG: glycosyltransferase family 2 protein [Dyadobacter sp.]|uniref:glycosyltransferase family 2 protein n=1 Tax=Dyadobacter sp. TaxID=1914288 RepID=UPI00326623D2
MLSPAVRGYAPLYWMLIIAFVFTCLKILHEWCHYFYITVPKTPPLTKLYTVDIFTTFCAGEPYEMILETLTAIQTITYPHQTYLCDEANDPYLRQVCLDLGVHHVTRTDKRDAKAGNINNALRQSTGELCVVLDPDHVPFPDFLDPIISHFNNPKIGYVQIVQAYKNNDEGLIAKGAAQQTYQFYGPMMMTMNRYGTVLAIGANCTFRRTALESIGGHAAGLAEDMHTSMQLHAKGWRSVYVPAVLAKGLVPSTLSAYYKQQLKWSRGVFDLFVHVYPKLFSQFTWQQKLHYGVIPLHYMSGFIFLINFLIPIFSLFIGVSPMHINIEDFGLVVLPLIAAIVLIRHFVQWWVMEDEERGFHIVGGLLMIGTWWIFILGFVYTIFDKKVPYVPTPKDGNEANNWPLNIPNLAVLALSVVAIAYGLYTDWNPYNIIMAGFAGMNCFFMCFNIAASRQQQFRILRTRYHSLNVVMIWIQKLKGYFWIVRRHIYSGVRTSALSLVVFLIGILIYITRFRSGEDESIHQAIKNETHAKKAEAGNTETNFRKLSNALGIPYSALDTVPDKVTPHAFFSGTRGVNYKKGHEWANRYPAFTKSELVRDFTRMKQAGINTIKHYGPGIYDYNILKAADNMDMNIHYGFWIPNDIDFVKDQEKLSHLHNEIVRTVANLGAKTKIISWNIGNAILQKIPSNPANADDVLQQKAYLLWIKQLSEDIRNTDPGRPVTLDIGLEKNLSETMRVLHQYLPDIAAFGLTLTDEKLFSNIPQYLPAPYFLSYTDISHYQEAFSPNIGAFISNWQDEQTKGLVNFDGLIDYSGRSKFSLQLMSHLWKNSKEPGSIPKIKILKPAASTVPGTQLTYHAIIQKNGQWVLVDSLTKDLQFEWKLIRTDGFNNPIEMQNIGGGPKVVLNTPPHPSIYQLYLFVIRQSVVVDIVESTLNTPLRPAKL